MQQSIVWLIILILFGIGEAVTVGLTSIWFAVGALGALIVSGFGGGFLPQIAVFIILSAISMLLVRPVAKKILKPGYSATNADRVLGAVGVVTEEIDNMAGKGLVNLSGQVWSARSQDAQSIPVGNKVRVLQIQGVKVLVAPTDVEPA